MELKNNGTVNVGAKQNVYMHLSLSNYANRLHQKVSEQNFYDPVDMDHQEPGRISIDEDNETVPQ